MPKKIATGISGLDELVGGGIPEGRVILVIGGPGTGKTILCSQFLYKGINEKQENGVFVSLDESKDHFYSEMQKFGWDFRKLEEEEIRFRKRHANVTSSHAERETLQRRNSQLTR